MSDNSDHNFGTFDDFGVKNDQKVSNNMILMPKYKGKHGGKKGKEIREGASPPPFRAMPERNIFFQDGFPKNEEELQKHVVCLFVSREPLINVRRRKICWGSQKDHLRNEQTPQNQCLTGTRYYIY